MAIQIVREVSADVVKRGATRAVYAKQNDVNSRFLNIRIQVEGTDIKIEPTATVMLNVERPDKQENIFYGTVNADGTVKVPLTSWMLELEGTLLCDVSIVDEDPTVAKLTTMQFNIYIEAAVISDESFEETEEYSVIVDLLNRTAAAEEQAASAAASASEAAKSADELKARCETATENAENATNELETIKEEIAEGGFVEGLRERNKGVILGFWIGTTEEYEALAEPPENCYVILTDDKTMQVLKDKVEGNTALIESLHAILYQFMPTQPTTLNKVLWESDEGLSQSADIYIYEIPQYTVIKVEDAYGNIIVLNRDERGFSATVLSDASRDSDDNLFIGFRRYWLGCEGDNIHFVSYDDETVDDNSDTSCTTVFYMTETDRWQTNRTEWPIKKITGVI